MKTFRTGGIHPEENKITAGTAIKNAAIPPAVTIPLAQCIGAPSVPVVNVGDKVLTGQLIARGNTFISANIHSSVSGTVINIGDAVDASGYTQKCIIINSEGDKWMLGIDKSQDLKTEISLTKEEIITHIRDAGIVGLGGAAFPTHVKLMVPEGKKTEFLIINAAECEPYLTSDHRILLEKGEEVLIGTKILMKALEVEKAIIGIENNKTDAIAHLTGIAEKYEGISLCVLKAKYPQGGEKQLINAILNREVPSGRLPVEVGCVVHNTGTAFAVYEAVQKNKPLFERVVTVTGKSVKNPCNLRVRIGTPVSFLLEEVGGVPLDTGKIIGGGPMMGKAINSVEIPVVKGMSGFVLITAKEARRMKVANCIRCARCIDACPMGLAPYLIAQTTETGQENMAEKMGVMDCIECGSCAYSCPSGRPLLENIRVAKNKVGHLIRSRTK